MRLIKKQFLLVIIVLAITNIPSLAQHSEELDSKQSSRIYSPPNNFLQEKTSSDSWSSLGPKGICVNDLAIDPANSNKIIAGGLAGLYITTNGGQNWNIVNTIFYNVWIGDVKFHPTNSNIILASGDNRIDGKTYIYRSIDAGTTWQVVKQTYDMNYGKIVIAKNNPNIVYCEGYYLYKSTDAGATWTEYSNLPKIEEYDVYDQDPNKLYAFAYQPVSPYNYELFSSLDGGSTWTKILTLDKWLSAIKISSNNFSMLYAGSSDRTATGGYGFLKSIDGGNTWTATTTGFGKFSKITSISFYPDNSNIIYACGSGTSLMRSLDAGATWTDLMTNIIDHYVYGVKFDSQNNLYVFTGSNIYKMTSTPSFQSISGDLANTDVFQIHFSPTNYSVIYLASLGGVLRTTNGGQTWVQKSNGIIDNDIFSLGINPQNPNIIFAGTFGGLVYKTTDGGDNWVEKTTGLTGLNGNSILGIGFNPQNLNNVFVLEGSSRIFSSTNSGDSWNEYKVNSESIRSLDFCPSSKNIWYAYTVSGGKIYKSIDYGLTWNMISATNSLYSITIDANDPNTLYADQYINSQDNISKSTNSGLTWNIVYPNLYVRNIYSVPGASNTLYAASWNSGVYKTTNGGTNWSQSNVGLTYLSCFLVRNQPGSTSAFLVATYGGGVFGYNYTPTGVKKENDFIAAQYTLENNYPNPFNPSTNIKYTLPKNSFVSLKVYDMLGREVKTLVSSELVAGNHFVIWKGDDNTGHSVSSGPYLYTIITDNFVQSKKMIFIK